MGGRTISIVRIMMIIALAAANCALLREVSWAFLSFPTIWAGMGILDFLILWKLILRRTLRASHYTFLILFVPAFVILHLPGVPRVDPSRWPVLAAVPTNHQRQGRKRLKAGNRRVRRHLAGRGAGLSAVLGRRHAGRLAGAVARLGYCRVQPGCLGGFRCCQRLRFAQPRRAGDAASGQPGDLREPGCAFRLHDRRRTGWARQTEVGFPAEGCSLGSTVGASR